MEVQNLVRKELVLEPLVSPPDGLLTRPRVANIISKLRYTFIESIQSDYRKGGLIGLAATAFALKDRASAYLDQILPPVLLLLSDHDARVRYYACEALLNICRVVRIPAIKYFHHMYDGLCRLYCDVDIDVRNGAAVLDKQLREIISQTPISMLEEALPLFFEELKERLPIKVSSVRLLNSSWLVLMDSVTGNQVCANLFVVLRDLILMLSDTEKDVRRRADASLSYFFEHSVKRTKDLTANRSWMDAVVQILVEVVCDKSLSVDNGEDFVLVSPSQSENFSGSLCRLISLQWLEELAKDIGFQFLITYPSVLNVALHGIADEDPLISTNAKALSKCLLVIFKNTQDPNYVHSELPNILEIVTPHVNNSSDIVRMAALEWISFLLKSISLDLVPMIFPSLDPIVGVLHDDDMVVLHIALDILATICQIDSSSPKCVFDALTVFLFHHLNVLESRGPLLVVELCKRLTARKVYTEFSQAIQRQSITQQSNANDQESRLHELIQAETALNGAALLVQTLNFVLLTSHELSELRELLRESVAKNIFKERIGAAKLPIEMFQTLFQGWCHDPVCAISLCMVAGFYELGSVLISLLYVKISLGVLIL
jgi:vacuole morphology and inheritance protein 14